MKYYLAPLEGITGYLFRNTIEECFPGTVDKYFTPFFTPHTKRTMNTKEMNDILSEHNKGICLIPQILTNSSEDFLLFEKDMHDFGYPEVNINLGCPSNTVFNKGRGSGALRDPYKLDEFLYGVYEKKTGPVSVKTRLGVMEPEEFYELLEVYNKYPMEELIIHVRVRQEFYKGLPHQDMFVYAMKNSKNPLCYNGDLWGRAELDALTALTEKETGSVPVSVMAGRPAVANPAVFRELAGGPELTRKELKHYLEVLRDTYREIYVTDSNVLYKMKEIWTFMIRRFPGEEKNYKKILKAKKLEEYKALERAILG